MKSGQKVTKEEVLQCISSLKKVFDIVRVVDPYHTQVLDDNFRWGEADNICYKMWDKNKRCSNCISLKAFTDFERKEKYEFKGNRVFFVVVMPFMITDEDNRIVVVEMLNDVSGEMFLHSIGDEVVDRTIHEIDHKLYIDSLTGVYNRRYFDEKMFIYEPKKSLSKEVGFILLDLKHFKQINDTHGHMAGDHVLQLAAEVMQQNTREDDAVIRLGGDEFLVIMQNCNQEGMVRTMERIKCEVHNATVPDDIDQHMEINAGYAFTSDFDASDKAVERLFEQADQNMYSDKRGKAGYGKE